MKVIKLAVLIIGIVGILFGLTLNAQARGGGNPPVCQVDVNSVLLGNSVKGTVTGVVTNETSSQPVTGDLDATLRLVWKGKEAIYRTHVPNLPEYSAEDALCAILASNPVNDYGIPLSEVVGVSSVDDFKITNSSITGFNFGPVPGAGTTSSAIGEAVIYILK